MKTFKKVWFFITEQDDVMTFAVSENEIGATIEQSSLGVCKITATGLLNKAYSLSNVVYGTPPQNVCIDSVTSSPNAIYISSLNNGVQGGNVFYNTPVMLWVEVDETYTNDQLATILHAQSLLIAKGLPLSAIGAQIPRP